MKNRIIVGLLMGIVAVICTMIIKSESLPFNNYLYESDVLTVIFGILNLPVFVVLLLTQINYPPFALLLIFIQWFLIGIFLHWIFARVRMKFAIAR